MNFFSTLIEQLATLFNSQAMARRVLVFGILGVSISGLVYIMTRARSGSFKTVATVAQPGELAEAIWKLHQLDIPTSIDDSGTTLKVPNSKYHQAAMILAEEGLVGGRAIQGYSELMDSPGIGLSDFEQKVRFHRSLEGELARTVMWINGVDRARVHLARPQPSLFITERAKPTASVMLKLRPGVTLTGKNVLGIANLVANAVEDLEPEAVTIVDTKTGRMLNEDLDADGSGSVTSWVSYKTDFENRLKRKIEGMLERTVGAGKVIAHVNAEFDFRQKTTTSETFNPDEVVARRQNIRADGPLSSATARTSGPTGSGSNLVPGGGATGSTSIGAAAATEQFDRETFFEISKTTSHEVQTVPILLRQSVAVLVDGIYDETDDGSGNITRTFKEREDLSDLEVTVKSVIGFTEDRGGNVEGDVVSVSSVPFQIDTFDSEEALPASPFLSPDMIREAIRWGIVGLIGVLLIFLVLRPAVKSVSLVPMPAAAQGSLPAPARRDVAAQLPGGSQAVAGLPEGAEGLADFDDEELDDEHESIVGADSLRKLRKESKIHEELMQATKSNIPKAAGIVRQWLDEG